jgi:recombination protein RecR
MKYSSKFLQEAVEAMSSLPSVGKKSALRMVLHLIKDDTEKLSSIVNSLTELDQNLKTCSSCYNYSDDLICNICKDSSRVKDTICVVESARDVMAIEETEHFRGMYHVLGGVISPLEGVGQEDLNIASLVERIEDSNVKELIMALSPTVDGDTTVFYISKKLEMADVNISTIARGVSFGGELEYADELTLGRSIISRIPYSLKTD